MMVTWEENPEQQSPGSPAGIAVKKSLVKQVKNLNPINETFPTSELEIGGNCSQSGIFTPNEYLTTINKINLKSRKKKRNNFNRRPKWMNWKKTQG